MNLRAYCTTYEEVRKESESSENNLVCHTKYHTQLPNASSATTAYTQNVSHLGQTDHRQLPLDDLDLPGQMICMICTSELAHVAGWGAV